jgi:hypothetical protein
MKRPALAALAAVLMLAAIPAAALPHSNELAVDIPLEGGAMLMYARDYRIARYVRLGLLLGGGQIDRRPTVRLPDGQQTQARIQTAVFPFIGPRITFASQVVGISIGFAVFHAKADTELDWPGQGRYSGSTTAWGTGFHAPFLELEFADSKRDLVYGFGLGGFFSASFPDLTASGAPGSVSLNASPIDTLTGRIKVVWGFGRVRQPRAEDDDF